MKLLGRKAVLEKIQAEYGFSSVLAERLIAIAVEFGIKGQATDDGIVTIRYVHKLSAPAGQARHQFTIEPPRNRRKRAESVATTRNEEYPSTRTISPRHRTQGAIMPPRGRTATKAAEPEPVEAEEAERDYTVYAEKDLTATMLDFTQWLIDEVFAGSRKEFEAAEPERLVSLAGTLRTEFQRSDFSKERRAERQAARAAGNGAEADEDEAEPITKATKTRGKAASKATGEKASTAKPTRGRGRAAATAAAPY